MVIWDRSVPGASKGSIKHFLTPAQVSFVNDRSPSSTWVIVMPVKGTLDDNAYWDVGRGAVGPVIWAKAASSALAKNTRFGETAGLPTFDN